MLLELIEAERRRIRREKFLDSAGKVVFGATFGFAIGSMLGVLFAPKSGEETRKELYDKADEVSKNIRNRTNEFVENAEDLAKEVRSDVANKIYDFDAEGGSSAVDSAFEEIANNIDKDEENEE